MKSPAENTELDLTEFPLETDDRVVLTEQNAGWPFYKLYQELRKEHEAMHGISKDKEEKTS